MAQRCVRAPATNRPAGQVVRPLGVHGARKTFNEYATVSAASQEFAQGRFTVSEERDYFFVVADAPLLAIGAALA